MEKDYKEYFEQFDALLLEMRKKKLDAIEEGGEKPEDDVIVDFRRRWRVAVGKGLKVYPAPKKRIRLGLCQIPNGKTRALLLKLQELEECSFLFLKKFEVDYSNNISERSIRFSKVRQSVSKCFLHFRWFQDVRCHFFRPGDRCEVLHRKVTDDP